MTQFSNILEIILLSNDMDPLRYSRRIRQIANANTPNEIPSPLAFSPIRERQPHGYAPEKIPHEDGFRTPIRSPRSPERNSEKKEKDQILGESFEEVDRKKNPYARFFSESKSKIKSDAVESHSKDKGSSRKRLPAMKNQDSDAEIESVSCK